MGKKKRAKAKEEAREEPKEKVAEESVSGAPMPRTGPGPHTLVIDIGGTGIKMITIDADAQQLNERARELTPDPPTPDAVLEVCERMVAAQPAFDRISAGFPGVVQHGIVHTAPNLSTKAWRGIDVRAALESMSGKPVRVANDAELQGYGVIGCKGVELVITLGTGLGSGLYTDGHLAPNLELGHHPLTRGKTYEERVSNAERKRIGNKRWNERVAEVIAQLEPIFNYDRLYIGGGNARRLTLELPDHVELFTNVEGLAGGIRLWDYGPE